MSDTKNLVEPSRCPHCGYEDFEPVELYRNRSHAFITRVADALGWRRLFPLAFGHPLHGWRCEECGYVMWFTARTMY